MSKFYDGSFILSKNKVWNFLLGNRNAGKSFYWKTYAIKKFLKGKEEGRKDCKFALFHRKVEDVKLTSPGFFDDVMDIKFEGKTMTFKASSNGFGRFYLDGELCGYSLAIKNYVTYKKMAELQSVETIIMDEFLSERGDYLPGEVDMVRNIYSTIARGGGKFIRDNVRMYFISNTVSMVNPYFKEFPEIKESFKFNTKRIVRDNFVLELAMNEDATKALSESKFGRSIEGTAYAQYALNNDFYLDNYKFVEKVGGMKDYVVTIIMNGNKFAIYQSLAKGFVYISPQVDNTHPQICIDNEDHDVNYLMIQQNETFWKNLARLYRKGCVRFQDLDCKIAFLALTSITKDY